MGTWQAQIVGRRRWRVCAPEEGNAVYRSTEGEDYNVNFMGGARASKVDTFSTSSSILCFDETTAAGEILYYPPRWWHQALNLDPESIAISGRVLAPQKYNLVLDSLKAHCAEQPPYADCYDARFELGLRTPPKLIDFPRAGASVCRRLDQLKLFLASAIPKMEQFEQNGIPNSKSATQKNQHHARLIETKYYSHTVAPSFAGKCDVIADNKDEI